MTFDKSLFRVVKHVTRQLLKLENDKEVYVEIESAIFQAEQSKKPKMIKQADGTEVPQPPPFIMNVKNLAANDAPSQIVCNEVLREELTKQYKNDSYVGKCFEFIKHAKVDGKNYNTFSITEIERAGNAPEAPKNSKK